MGQTTNSGKRFLSKGRSLRLRGKRIQKKTSKESSKNDTIIQKNLSDEQSYSADEEKSIDAADNLFRRYDFNAHIEVDELARNVAETVISYPVESTTVDRQVVNTDGVLYDIYEVLEFDELSSKDTNYIENCTEEFTTLSNQVASNNGCVYKKKNIENNDFFSMQNNIVENCTEESTTLSNQAASNKGCVYGKQNMENDVLFSWKNNSIENCTKELTTLNNQVPNTEGCLYNRKEIIENDDFSFNDTNSNLSSTQDFTTLKNMSSSINDCSYDVCGVNSTVAQSLYENQELNTSHNATNSENITDDLIIEKEKAISPDKNAKDIVNGRRMIDVNYFLKQLHETYENHKAGIDCPFRDWKLVNHRLYGLKTKLCFKCDMCGYTADGIWLVPNNEDVVSVNKAAVIGTVTTGIGHSQMQEWCASVDMKCMAAGTYRKIREDVIEEFLDAARKNIATAVEQEKKLAIENNEVIDGIPYITVIADGEWSKRSYGHGYDALSGVGVIIGYRTGKVLYFGVRNKYCSYCEYYERKKMECPSHKCYKNFDRKQSSTSMESDAIAEGFKRSIEMHGIIYKTLIADNDSNVYKAIIDNRTYSEQQVVVKKVDCTNHLYRNLCKKLTTIAETKQTQGSRNSQFIQARNIIKKNILPIRETITEAASFRQNEDKPEEQKSIDLQNDILNVANHVFGDHSNCRTRGFNCSTISVQDEVNFVPMLLMHGLYQKVENILQNFSSKAESLLLNLTNNHAEWFNSILCKEIGGKRINIGARGSYDARVAGSVLQYNSQQVLSEYYTAMSKTVPAAAETLEKQRQEVVSRTRMYRNEAGGSRKKNFNAPADEYYGPQSQKLDMDPACYEQVKQHHMKKLQNYANTWELIEQNTREQHNSDYWKSIRQDLLTASNFGKVCCMRPTTSCANTVKQILYPSPFDTEGMRHGRDNEALAKKDVAASCRINIENCGLFICQNNPFLGASPDGLIDDDGLIEIKCPISAKDLTVEEAINTVPLIRSIFDKKNVNEMNRNHKYFYQIQGQLNITKRQYCLFVIWTLKNFKVLRVERDEVFWEQKMKPLLVRFYNECLLPEIIDSRHNRRMPIRNPDYIISNQEEAARRKSETNLRKKRKNVEDNSVTAMKKKLSHSVTYNDILEDEDEEFAHEGYENEVLELTGTDEEKRQFLNDRVTNLQVVKRMVLPLNSDVNDASIDMILKIIRDTTEFQTQSVQFVVFRELVEPCVGKSIQIIGGNAKHHWRCIYFDGSNLRIYDSLPNKGIDSFVHIEQNYLQLRFPDIEQSNIIVEKVQRQKDNVSCGIFAAAFATSLALGENPCNITYSYNMTLMRRHFVQIVQRNELLPFPPK